MYDDDGNISRIKGKESASATETVLQSYTYDAFGQLTAENDAENNRSAAFTYDLNGNILSKVETVNGTSTTHTYQYGNSQWRDLLTAYDGDAITYDAGGNPLTYRDGITFTWKNGRQLASYEDSTYRITYDYNDSGIRVKKTVTEKSTGTVIVTENYLEGANIIAQKITTTPSGGTSSTEMIWYIYDGTGTVVGMQTEDGTYYYEKNLQGDITAIVNESGAEAVSYRYDAWGNVISSEDTSGVQLVEKNPFTYRGYYRDNETGFYYLQSRYYDSETGRFLNADTTDMLFNSAEITEKNLYTYCKNNSANHFDLFGMKTVSLSTLALLLDVIIFALCLPAAVSFDFAGAAFKAACKHLLKKAKNSAAIKKAVHKVMRKFSKKIMSAINKIKNFASKISKKLPRAFRETMEFVLSTLSSSLVNKLLSQICKKIDYVFLLFSVGGIVALLCDVRQNKRITGYIRLW